MTDEIKAITSQYEEGGATTEHNKHRAQAVEYFGGPVHVVGQNTSAVPRHDALGNHTGHIFIMTTVWKKAPADPAQETASQPEA